MGVITSAIVLITSTIGHQIYIWSLTYTLDIIRNAGGFYRDLEVVITSAIGCQIGPDQHGMRLVKVTGTKPEKCFSKNLFLKRIKMSSSPIIVHSPCSTHIASPPPIQYTDVIFKVFMIDLLVQPSNFNFSFKPEKIQPCGGGEGRERSYV